MIVNPTTAAIALRTVAVEVVRAGSVLQREAGRLFKPFGVTAAQFNVVNLLALHPEGMSAGEIARSLVVDPSSTTYLLDQLEDRHWAERRRHATDRRTLRIVLTPVGRALHTKLLGVYHEALQRMASTLNPTAIAGALPLLETLPGVAVEVVDAFVAAREHRGASRRKTPRRPT